MVILEYRILYDDLSNSGGMELRAAGLRHQAKLARFLERFILSGTAEGHRVAPELRAGRLEVYVLPSPPDVQRPTLPLALVRVDHTAKTLELIKVFRGYTSAEGTLWEQIVAIARQAIGEA
jgi:hypothetical protein